MKTVQTTDVEIVGNGLCSCGGYVGFGIYKESPVVFHTVPYCKVYDETDFTGLLKIPGAVASIVRQLWGAGERN